MDGTTASAKVTIRNELGMHARPASAFREAAARFECAITVERIDFAQAADGKSVLGLLGLGLTCGTVIEIRAEGADAAAAVEALVALVESKFGTEPG